MYASAQYLDFLDLAKNCSFPNQKRARFHPGFPDGNEIEGLRYKGTGFLVSGSARMVTGGPEVEEMKKTNPWLRAVLEVTVDSCQQTL